MRSYCFPSIYPLVLSPFPPLPPCPIPSLSSPLSRCRLGMGMGGTRNVQVGMGIDPWGEGTRVQECAGVFWWATWWVSLINIPDATRCPLPHTYNTFRVREWRYLTLCRNIPTLCSCSMDLPIRMMIQTINEESSQKPEPRTWLFGARQWSKNVPSRSVMSTTGK